MSDDPAGAAAAPATLKAGALHWLQVSALGIAIAISGNVAGWNYGLGVGGWGGMLLAALAMALLFWCLTQSLAELAAALGLPAGSIAATAPIRAVSVSRAKLIVPLTDADAVHRVRPDFPALWELCGALATTGAYVFAPHQDGDPRHVVARQFPVDAGYPEDPATGVAAAALAAYLASELRPDEPAWTHVIIDQGDAMGQPSRLRAAALAGPDGITRTSVTGQAIRTGQSRLSLDTIADLPAPELR